MANARTLTNGRGPRRNRRDVPNPDFAALRRLTTAANPNMDTFRAVLTRVAANPAPVRPREARAYADARRRYAELVATGHQSQA